MSFFILLLLFNEENKNSLYYKTSKRKIEIKKKKERKKPNLFFMHLCFHRSSIWCFFNYVTSISSINGGYFVVVAALVISQRRIKDES
jgi:hypothetical protein